MVSNTHNQSAAQPPAILSGQEIYDRIMSEIEPELMSAVLPTLNQKYANQNEAEKTVRNAHYQTCFAEYDKRFAEYCRRWDEDFRAYKRAALEHVENTSRGLDISRLTDIESALVS